VAYFIVTYYRSIPHSTISWLVDLLNDWVSTEILFYRKKNILALFPSMFLSLGWHKWSICPEKLLICHFNALPVISVSSASLPHVWKKWNSISCEYTVYWATGIL
jgi:hypothetical protein